MSHSESDFYTLVWATDVDRRINAAIGLDRATREAVESVSNLLAAFLNHANVNTQPRLIMGAADTLHFLSGLLDELETSRNVRLPILQDQSASQAGD